MKMQEGGALMSAKQVQLFRRLVFPLALVVWLVVSAYAVSSPALAAPTREPAKSPPFVAKLQPLLQAKMQQWRIPGAMVYVDDPGQGTWITALGIGNLATREPMQVNNFMRIGSLTKTFTTTVILQLVDQHKLRLDDPVSKYQPEVPNGAHITIRELLNMTSGLVSYDDDEGLTQALFADPYRVWSPNELLVAAFKHPPYFAPGTGWHYSNTNTILLGLIVEQLTHHSLEDAFQRYLFGPLGMHQTSLPSPTSSAIPDPHAQGYMYGTDFTGTGPTLNVTDWNSSWAWAAGGAISTLHDLKIWAKALATGQLLSAATQKERLSFVNTGLSWLEKPWGYGLGVADYSGFLGHSGVIFGYTSWMAYQPQTGATIIVLTNLYLTANHTGPAEELARVIQQELFA
jgi:D-alanyl-D-alanine carboxypeptidase